MTESRSGNPFDVGYHAARHSAALFDLDDWTNLAVTGRDAATLLQNLCTSDVKALAAGEGCEAFLTNVKARVLGHVLVQRRADDAYRLLTAPAQGPALIEHLDRYIITEDVNLADETHQHGLFALVGPDGESILRELGAEPPTPPGAHRFAMVTSEIAGEPVAISTFDGLGLGAYLIETELEATESLWARLKEAGATTAELDVFNSLRIEAVYPWGGYDIDDKHLAPEVDRPWVINLTKGCYLGQEPIARIDALGHVNRVLRGLRLEEEAIPEFESDVFDGDKKIGQVRSTATSGADGTVIALAMLRASHATAGTRVTVRSGEMESGAVVFEGGRVKREE